MTINKRTGFGLAIALVLLASVAGFTSISSFTSNANAENFSGLWSNGLKSVRTGEPLIEEGGEHKLDPASIKYGYNLVVGADGGALSPRAVPLKGGEQLSTTDAYQDDNNTREYARIYTIMAPIRDTILYHFESTSLAEWQKLTEVLASNNIKTKDASKIDRRAVLSSDQVYEYVSGGPSDGSAVMRYLEEAGLELKCLAFKDFNFVNPEGADHCKDHGFETGSGIK